VGETLPTCSVPYKYLSGIASVNSAASRHGISRLAGCDNARGHQSQQRPVSADGRRGVHALLSDMLDVRIVPGHDLSPLIGARCFC